MTGIFFGSTMGTTEAVAADIAKQLGVADADVHNVADTPAGEVQKYDLLVLGSSTWGAGELQDDWYGFLDQLKAQDLSGKKVALFGCGDSGSYPDTFCDAVGLIYDGLQQSCFIRRDRSITGAVLSSKESSPRSLSSSNATRRRRSLLPG